MKYNKLIGLIIIISIFTYSLIFSFNQNEINNTYKYNHLININTYEEEKTSTYLKEIETLNKSENKDNILIIISEKEIDDDTATNIVKAPNNQYFVEYETEEEKNNALEKFKEDNLISVEENNIYTISSTDFNSWGIEKMALDDKIIETNNNYNDEIVVAIIDTGLDVDLFKQHYPNKLSGTYNILESNVEMYDINGHGTHIAGTIAEATPDNIKIQAIKVSDQKNIYTSDIIEAINYIVLTQSANVINMSFSSDIYDKSLEQAIAGAYNNNIISIVATGNEGMEKPTYPAALDNTISVSAVNYNLQLADFSNYHETVDFTAPGDLINSINGQASGTSMAAPHVAAAAAIIKSEDKDFTFTQIMNHLKSYTVDIGDPGIDNKYGNGFINFIETEDYINPLLVNKIHVDEFSVANLDYKSNSNLYPTFVKLYHGSDINTELPLHYLHDYEINNYDYNNLNEQTITLEFLGFETTAILKATTQKNIGWVYTTNNNKITLTDISGELTHGKIFIPSEINNIEVDTLGNNLFNNNEFYNIHMEDTIKYIEDNSISNNNNLMKINLSQNIESIGINSIYNNNELEEIILPKNINSIGANSLTDNDIAIFYTYENSNIINHFTNETISNELNEIIVNQTTTNYIALEQVNKNNITLNLKNYPLNYFVNNNLTINNQIISNYDIKYQNNNQNFIFNDEFYYIETTINNNNFKIKMPVSISKITPSYTVPTNITATQYQSLSDIDLPDNFYWMNDLELTTTGSQTFKAKYIPDDILNYETIENIDITIVVEEYIKNIINPTITIKDKTYDNTTTINTDNINILELNEDDYIIDNITTSNKEIGSSEAEITITLSEDIFKYSTFDNNTKTKTFTVEYEIVPIKVEKPTPVAKNYIYNSFIQKLELNNYDDTIMNITGDTRTNAGSQITSVSLTDPHYAWTDNSTNDLEFTFNINQAPINYNYISNNKTITKNGEYHTIDLTVISPENAKIKYANQDGDYILNEIPKYKDTGIYTIKFKIYIDDNHTEIYNENTLNITEDIINKTTDYSSIYNGLEHTLKIDINVDNYTITYTVNDYTYNLNTLPKFKLPGVYQINYKIKYNNKEILGSNKVTIYGTTYTGENLLFKDNFIIIRNYNSNFNDLTKSLITYANHYEYFHYDEYSNIITNNIISTSDIFKVNINGNIPLQYNLILLGDVSEDGKISSLDYVKIKNHIMSNNILEKDTTKLSADINEDSKISSLDYVKIKNLIMNGGVQ